MEPTSGKLYYNNQEISKNKSEWIKNISYVSQDNNLFSGTIYENIAFTFDKNEIDKSKINDLLKKININFFNKFKHKLNKNISYNSRNISGGEKQRISIARGLFKGKKIIILDEVTSSLDLKNSNEIMRELKKFRKNKIIFLISHKSSSFNICDDVYEIKDFKLVKDV